MKRAYSFGLGALFFGTLLITAPAQTFFYWTGLGTGWQGQVTPPNDGTANFFLGKAINQTVTLPGDFSLNAIVLATGTSSDTYYIKAAIPLTLTVNGAIVTAGTGIGRLVFDSNINLSGGSNLVFSADTSTMVIPGQIIGNSALFLSGGSSPNATGAFIFNNTGAGNTYIGDTSISGVTGSPVTVAFWNNSPFGSGALNVYNSAQLIAHNTLTVTNAITFSTLTANDPVYFKSWDRLSFGPSRLPPV